MYPQGAGSKILKISKMSLGILVGAIAYAGWSVLIGKIFSSGIVANPFFKVANTVIEFATLYLIVDIYKKVILDTVVTYEDQVYPEVTFDLGSSSTTSGIDINWAMTIGCRFWDFQNSLVICGDYPRGSDYCFCTIKVAD